MRKLVLFTLLVLLIITPVNAGIGLFEGSITLSALETKTICNLIVYSTIPGNLSYHVGYTQDIEKFVSSVEPNHFYLLSIDDYGCAGDGEPRRDCIKSLCMEGKDEYCRVICSTFSGPFELSLNPKSTRYNGGVRDVVQAGAATVTNAQPFIIYYTPYDAKWVILYVIVALVIIALILKFGRKMLRRSKGA